MRGRDMVIVPNPASPPRQQIRILVVPDIDETAIAQARFGAIEHVHIVRPADPRWIQPFMRYLRLKLYRWEFADSFITDRFIPAAAEIVPNGLQHGTPSTPVGVNLDVYGRAPRRVVTLLVSNCARADQVRGMVDAVRRSEMGERLFDLRGRGLAIAQSFVDGLQMLIYRDYSVHVVCYWQEDRRPSC